MSRAKDGPNVSDAPRPDETTADGEPVTAAADQPEVLEPDAEEAAAPEEGEAEHVDLEAAAEADPRTKGELLAELTSAESKRDEYLDDLRRSHAEFENFRRRLLRDGAAQRESGRAEVVEQLLEVLDDLDRTLDAAAHSSDEQLSKGVELVASKLVGALSNLGVTRLDEVEVVFDPNVHEAVQQRESEDGREEPTVVEVLRPGYRLGEKVLRPAMVVVEQ